MNDTKTHIRIDEANKHNYAMILRKHDGPQVRKDTLEFFLMSNPDIMFHAYFAQGKFHLCASRDGVVCNILELTRNSFSFAQNVNDMLQRLEGVSTNHPVKAGEKVMSFSLREGVGAVDIVNIISQSHALATIEEPQFISKTSKNIVLAANFLRTRQTEITAASTPKRFEDLASALLTQLSRGSHHGLS